MSKTNLPYDRAADGKLLTVLQVSERLKCHKSYVYKLIGKHELRHIRLGDIKGLRITERSLLRYLKRRGE
ncbi:helix-turn-helix domain-containing protein [Desulfovibrio sp. JY]|nr:helix-turn-helix domain-containing protein [Desulfovibrio sp. JY]